MPQNNNNNNKGGIHLVLILLIALLAAGSIYYKNSLTNFIVKAGKPGSTNPSPTPSLVCNLSTIAEFNKSLSFVGTSDNNNGVIVTEPQTIRLSGDFTIEAWIKLAELSMQDTTVVRTIISRQSTSDTAQVSLSLVPFSANTMPNPRLQFFVASLPYDRNYLGEWILSNTPILPNTWYHVAATKEGNQLRMFINGRLDETLKIAGNTAGDGVYTGQVLDDGDSDITIGGFVYSNPTFGGQPEDLLDEVRISKIARYSGNFTVSKLPFSVDENTLALYHFDNDVTEATGNNNSQLQGNVQFTDSNLKYSPDSDYDGWSDCSENKIGTNLSKACPASTRDAVWVPDFNNNKVIDSNDRRIIDNAYTKGTYNKRYDLNTDGKFDSVDRNLIDYFINQTCN